MPRFQVNAPDRREVAVSTPYGIQKFIHGTFITDSRYAQLYPNIFIQVPEFNSAVIEEAVIIEEVKLKKKPVVKEDPKKKDEKKPKKKTSLPKKK